MPRMTPQEERIDTLIRAARLAPDAYVVAFDLDSDRAWLGKPDAAVDQFVAISYQAALDLRGRGVKAIDALPAAGDRRETVVSRGRLKLVIEAGLSDEDLAITVSDDRQLLGRLIIDAVGVTVWQPNDFDGPTIEWVGLGL